MTRYTAATESDRAEMLAAIGVSSSEQLFEEIPEPLRLGRPLDLPRGLAEAEVHERLAALAARNVDAGSEVCFLGAGFYDHYLPAIVDAITQRSEFLTPYTPYQPEVSQGGLQAMFEFQTAMSELTALPVASAGLYEGPSSAASAAYLAIAATGRRRLVVSRALHPHSRETLATYAGGFGAEVVETPINGGLTDAEALAAAVDEETAAVFLQNPNFLGAVEDVEALGSAASDHGALLVVAADPMTLGVLRPPGECGADIALGEGQPLGNRLDFGGPSFGFFCATEEHLRRMPGRIAGETEDADGRRGFVLALQTREQHIRREKATHNICTAQALNALAAVVHLSWLGRRGFRELGELLVRRTAYARQALSAVEGVEALHEAPVAREFALRLDAPVPEVLDRCAERGIAAGYPLGRDYPEYEDGLLVAITERRTREQIDDLARALGDAVRESRAGSQATGVGAVSAPARGGRGSERARQPVLVGASEREQGTRAELIETIFEKSKPGRRAAVAPEAGVPEPPLSELIPSRLLRAEPPRLPEVSEPEIVRHYNRLSRRNFDLDTGFYPLGSCTMKHNPRLNERVAALPGHAGLHPAQDPRRAQGALELMWLLQESLAEICGLPHVSLQPSAGSQGELAGLLLTRAYHADRGETRSKVLTPDTAHGTNPASVTMAGYEAVKVATNARGGVDVDDLREKLSGEVACLMLTNPNTLGLFDENIEEIAGLIHGSGGTLYYDGANLNAVMGQSRPGDMGFDIVHLNLHKTFSQPHGGGGPGSGPIAVSERIEPFLPRPQVVRRESSNGTTSHYFDLDFDRPKSIGRLRGFQGNFGVFVRSYAYILSLGADGLAEASETAVLNANYLKARLAAGRAGERLPVAFDRHCMHEFVLSGAPMRKELGLKTLDLAKRLLDFGFHPPTVYFPLLVEEALMIEPTETETKETLDAFAEAVEAILEEAEGDPDVARQAPYTTPVRRLDEVRASRKPVLRQPLD